MTEAYDRACALIGTPFRQQGRDPAIGLDCLGLVIWTYGIKGAPPARYRQGDGSWELVENELRRWFVPIDRRQPACCDLVVYRLSSSFHFGVVAGDHLIHADASLGKVVARPFPAALGRACRLFRYSGDV